MESPPLLPPAPPAAPIRCFPREAAQFSLWAPFVCFFFGLMAMPALKGIPWAQVALGVLQVLLILSGFILGIVALCGIKKHGSKGILMRAVVGLCLNGFFLFACLASVPAVLKAIEKSREQNRAAPGGR